MHVADDSVNYQLRTAADSSPCYDAFLPDDLNEFYVSFNRDNFDTLLKIL